MKIYHYDINKYSTADLDKFSKYCHKSIRQLNPQSVIAHFFTKKILSEYYNIDIAQINFKYNQYGKPYFKDDLKFSITHTSNHVFIAFDSKDVGIDAEAIRTVNKNLLRRTATQAEKSLLLSSDNFDLDFLKLWTIKEAYLKLAGTGLTFPLDFSAAEISENFSVKTYLEHGCVITVIQQRQ